MPKFVLAVLVAVLGCSQPAVDPTAWGDDYSDRPLPEYISGDECLFCHRRVVGPEWSMNPHQMTLERLDPTAHAGAEFAIGDGARRKLLRRSDAYGRLDMLTFADEKPSWDEHRFADRCAGCHATAVDSETGVFQELSLGCFVCHGDVPLEHTNHPEMAIFSKAREGDARMVVSTCGQCHLRGGQSKRTGRPYPAGFIAGDNLFRDLDVDLSPKALATADPIERHILENIRDAAFLEQTEMTCLSCHRLHRASTNRHRRVERSSICDNCHKSDEEMTMKQLPLRHSMTCEY